MLEEDPDTFIPLGLLVLGLVSPLFPVVLAGTAEKLRETAANDGGHGPRSDRS